MLISIKKEDAGSVVSKPEASEISEKSYSNADALQIMLTAMLKAMSSLLDLQAKEMKGQSEISKLSNQVSTEIIAEYKTQVEENAADMESKRTSDEVLKWFGIAATGLSLILGFVLGGPAGFAIALGLAVLLTPGLTSPSKNGDTSILGSALDGLLEDASPEVRGTVKMATIIGLCVIAGGIGGAGQAATNTVSTGTRAAATTFTAARFTATQAAVQGLTGLNPTYDFAMIGADKNDQERKEIAQWVAMGVNIAASLGAGAIAFKTPAVSSYNIFGSSNSARAFSSTVMNTSALTDTGRGVATIHGGTIRLDIAENQEGIAETTSVITEQQGLQKLSQHQVSQRSKDYKSTVEESNAAANQYADWTTALYASANAIAANAG